MVKRKIIKVCNFYVSRWHFLSIILPFIRDELKFKNHVIILSQDNLEENFEFFINKINISFYNSNGVSDIEWYKNYKKLELENDIYPANVIIQGTVEYINNVNSYFEQKFSKLYREIRIINCYELFDSNPSLYEILDKHDYILNTGGLKCKEYLFPDYQKVKNKLG